MTKLYVTEYQSPTIPMGNNAAVPTEPGVDQVVDYTAGAAASTAFKGTTQMIRISPDSICSVAFGTAPTATTSNRRLIAGAEQYVLVPLGSALKVSAITNT